MSNDEGSLKPEARMVLGASVSLKFGFRAPFGFRISSFAPPPPVPSRDRNTPPDRCGPVEEYYPATRLDLKRRLTQESLGYATGCSAPKYQPAWQLFGVRQCSAAFRSQAAGSRFASQQANAPEDWDWLVAQAFQPAGSGDFRVASLWSTGQESPVNRQAGEPALHSVLQFRPTLPRRLRRVGAG